MKWIINVILSASKHKQLTGGQAEEVRVSRQVLPSQRGPWDTQGALCDRQRKNKVDESVTNYHTSTQSQADVLECSKARSHNLQTSVNVWNEQIHPFFPSEMWFKPQIAPDIGTPFH